MAKTKEELNQLKQEYETLATKLNELSEEEIDQICGGAHIWDVSVKNKDKFEINRHDQDVLNW